PDEVLREGALIGVAECVRSRDIKGDFAWVCQTRRQSANIHNLFSAADYDTIRKTFSLEENHDAQLRNLIYCRNGSQIAGLVTNYCPAAATERVRDPERDHAHKGGLIDMSSGVEAGLAGVILIIGAGVGFVAGMIFQR